MRNSIYLCLISLVSLFHLAECAQALTKKRLREDSEAQAASRKVISEEMTKRMHAYCFWGIGSIESLFSGQEIPDVNDTKFGEPMLIKMSEDCLPFLFEQGADVNIRNSQEETPLIRAANYGHINKVLELLKVKGINLNAQDRNGCTALMRACRGKTELAFTLLCTGADVDIKDKDGKTAEDHVQRCLNESAHVITWWESDMELLLKTIRILKNLQAVAQNASIHHLQRMILYYVKPELAEGQDPFGKSTDVDTNHDCATIISK